MTPAYLIRSKRAEKGLTRKQLAELMSCSVSLISEYENANLLPTESKATKLCEILGIELSYFMLVSDVSKKLWKELHDLCKVGRYVEAQPVFKKMNKLEHTVSIKKRYGYHIRQINLARFGLSEQYHSID